MISEKSAHVIKSFQLAEYWTVKDEEIRDLLSELASRYEEPGITRWADENPRETLMALGLVEFGTCVDIAQGLERASPGILERLVSLSASSRNDALVRQLADRMNCLDKTKILSDLFSEDRLERVRQALASVNDRAGRYAT